MVTTDFVAFRAAILSAFPSRSELAQLVRLALDERLATIVHADQPLDVVVFELLEWCDARGRTTDLLAGAMGLRPRNPSLRALGQRLHVMPVVYPVAEVQPFAQRAWGKLAGAVAGLLLLVAPPPMTSLGNTVAPPRLPGVPIASTEDQGDCLPSDPAPATSPQVPSTSQVAIAREPEPRPQPPPAPYDPFPPI